MSSADTNPATSFFVGQQVRIRPEYRRPGDFDVAVIWYIDPADKTIDVKTHRSDDEKTHRSDWGQWFSLLDDGSYEIEPYPEGEEAP